MAIETFTYTPSEALITAGKAFSPDKAPAFPRVEVSKRIRYMHAVERFNAIQNADRAFQVGRGRIPEEVEMSLSEREYAFNKLSLSDQKDFLEEERTRVTSSVNSVFMESLCFYDELLIEANGKSNDEIAEIFNVRKAAFDSANLPRKVELALKMKTEAEDFLLRRFDVYTDAWRTALTNMGKDEDQVAAEIEKLEDRFLSASPRGQVGIAKGLREKLATAYDSKFNDFFELYTHQIREKGLNGSDFPSPQSFVESYTGASMKKRERVVQELEKLTYRALNARTVSFPSA